MCYCPFQNRQLPCGLCWKSRWALQSCSSAKWGELAQTSSSSAFPEQLLPDGVLELPVLLAEVWECCPCQKISNQQDNVAGESCHMLRHCFCGHRFLSNWGVRSAAMNTSAGVYSSSCFMQKEDWKCKGLRNNCKAKLKTLVCGCFTRLAVWKIPDFAGWVKN